MNTILVVDDEQRIRRIYKWLLEREGYRVIDVSNIIDARRYMKFVKIDLILLDINMGEFSGDVLYEISRTFHHDVKIIVSSVYPAEDQKRTMPEAVDYFDKSEGNRVLLNKVARSFGTKPRF